jgi:sugar transferase (PEP-CTERM/EpsH1 system associated)
MKLLVIASRFPYPLEKGDKLRLYHQLRELAATCEITLFAFSDCPVLAHELEAVRPFCVHIEVIRLHWTGQAFGLLRAWWTGAPFQTGYFFDKKARQRLQQLIRTVQPDHVFCQLIRVAEYVQACSVPATLDYMDTFSLGMRRRKDRSAWWLRPVLAREARTLARWEERVFPWFRQHTIISAQDRDSLNFPDASSICVIPNGVDTPFFTFQATRQPEFEVAFVGNLGYFPNRQACHTLVHDIMPLVWAIRPGTRVLLAGARPPAEIKSWESDPRICVTGWMEDIRDAYRMAGMLVAPLFTGSGQQNKVLEAMAMGVPCITTPLVNQALGAEAGQAILLAEDPASFAEAILHLLQHPNEAEQLRQTAHAFVVANYSWQASTGRLMALFSENQD